jgi:hypothetical protein
MVHPGQRRGELAFVGQVAGLGTWYGICLDEPLGDCDGTFVDGQRYFEARQKWGCWARPENVEVEGVLRVSMQDEHCSSSGSFREGSTEDGSSDREYYRFRGVQQSVTSSNCRISTDTNRDRRPSVLSITSCDSTLSSLSCARSATTRDSIREHVNHERKKEDGERQTVRSGVIPGEDISVLAYSLARPPPDARKNSKQPPPGWPRGLTLQMQKRLDLFPTRTLLPETPGLQPLLLENPPVERKHTGHFHSTACLGMTGEVRTDCVISRDLVCTEASKMDGLRLRMLDRRKQPTGWRSAEEVLDRCVWMDTAWEWHLCQWAINRFPVYKLLVQLKYYGWSCDFEEQQIDEISNQSYDDAWRDLDDLCGGVFSGCASADPDGDYVLPGKVFLYVGEHFPSKCFKEWGFRGVHLHVAAGCGCLESTAWNLSQTTAAPWPRTPTGAVQLWPEGEMDEIRSFDLIILDQPPKKSALVQGFLAFFLTHLKSGGALAVKLSSLPKCKALTPLWHLVRIFGCGSIRLRKPGSGPDVHRSSFYVICRDFPGAGIPSLRDLDQVSNFCLQFTSREVEVGRPDLPPMPTCIPTSSTVVVRHLCALLETLSRDAKPIWAKQYVALHSNLLALSAEARPHGLSLAKESAIRRREARKSRESTNTKKLSCPFEPRTWTKGRYGFLMLPGVRQMFQIVLMLILWISADFCMFHIGQWILTSENTHENLYRVRPPVASGRVEEGYNFHYNAQDL